MNKLRYLINSCIALLLVGGALVIAMVLASSRPVAPRAAQTGGVPEVKLAEVIPGRFDEPVIGYGTVRAKNQVRIIPQVSGLLTEMHDDMAVGKVIPKGELIFEIDRRTYESQVLQHEADITMLESQLKRHEKEKEHLTKQLTNAREQADLANNALERAKTLKESNSISDSEVELARQNYLVHQATVIELESKLDLIPGMIDESNARLEGRQALLADAKRNLESTRIVSPFDARVESVTVSESQLVIPNFAIAVLTDMRAFELAAVLDPTDLQWTHPLALTHSLGEDQADPPSVVVTWTMHGRRYTWTGYVSHLERHDEATRTARLVVEIPNEPIEVQSAQAGGSQPLSIGMFCSAEIPSEELDGAMVVPRSAIHEDNLVYTFQPDEGSDGDTGTLVAREVPILRTVGDKVLVDFEGRSSHERLALSDATAPCELQPGEFIIVSPISRPVEGMKLRRRGESLTSLTPAELVAQLQRPEPVHLFNFLKSIPVETPVAFLAP